MQILVCGDRKMASEGQYLQMQRVGLLWRACCTGRGQFSFPHMLTVYLLRPADRREASEGTTGLPPSGPSTSAAPSLSTSSMPAGAGVLPSAAGDGGEAKKKGRFTVIENNPAAGQAGLERKASHAALVDGQYRGGADYAPTLGGPPSGTLRAEGSSTSVATGGGPALPRPPAGGQHVLPVTSILPRLQELLDHSSQQHAALHRLLAAVQESDAGGKVAPALLRPGRALFDVSLGTALGSGGGAAAEPSLGAAPGPDSMDELRHMVRSLQARLSHAEVENARLRARNAQLEANLGVASGGGGGSGGGATPGPRTRETSESGGGAGPQAHSNGPLPSPRHAMQQSSPRPGWSPRASEDGIR